jgi:hypothetical protein
MIHSALQILRPKKIIFYLLLVEGAAVLSVFTARYLWSQALIQSQFTGSFIFFLQLCFYWIAGFPLVIFVFFHGVGLIAGEKKQGLIIAGKQAIPDTKIIGGKCWRCFCPHLFSV